MRVWDLSSVIGNAPPEDLSNLTPEELWERMQYKLGLTVTDDDEVVPLWPTGPRKLKGWDPSLVEKYGK